MYFYYYYLAMFIKEMVIDDRMSIKFNLFLKWHLKIIHKSWAEGTHSHPAETGELF